MMPNESKLPNQFNGNYVETFFDWVNTGQNYEVDQNKYPVFIQTYSTPIDNFSIIQIK